MCLARLRAEGREIVEIPLDRGFEEAARAAEAPLGAGVDAVYQGVFVDGAWRGIADFLIREPGGTYEAADAKLARHPRPHYLLREEDDHLVRVAGIRCDEIVELAGVGIETLAALARADPATRVPRLPAATFEKLRGQAFFQHAGVSPTSSCRRRKAAATTTRNDMIASALPIRSLSWIPAQGAARDGEGRQVDKFQGQEADVVFLLDGDLVSMATSSGEDVPRNLEFLFSRNRLNVAVSRARCLAYAVGSPRLLEVVCHTIKQMRMVSALCLAVEMAEGTWQSRHGCVTPA